MAGDSARLPILLTPGCSWVLATATAAATLTAIGVCVVEAPGGTFVATTSAVLVVAWACVLVVAELAARGRAARVDDLLMGELLETVAAGADGCDPAEAARLAEVCGRLLGGSRADLLEVAPDRPWQVMATWCAPASSAELDLAGVAEGLDGSAVDLGQRRTIVPLAAPATTNDPTPTVELALVVAASDGARLPTPQRVDRVRALLGLVVERRRMAEQLELLERTDQLTGLANRRSLTERLAEEVARARRNGLPLTTIMVDLDRFKDFNETYGQLAGDRALRSVAAALRDRLRVTDFVGRFGGEEFVLLLPGTTVSDAWRVVEELHDLVERLDVERPLTFSAGMAQWDQLEVGDELLVRADAALFDAKAAGRNRTCVRTTVDDTSRMPTDLVDPGPREPETGPRSGVGRRASAGISQHQPL